MKPLLMYADRDFEVDLSPQVFRYRERDAPWQQLLPPYERAVVEDLELDTLLRAMAAGDEFMYEIACKAIRSALRNNIGTILYRQATLGDCLRFPTVVRELYDLTVEATEGTKRRWWDLSSRYPSSTLYSATDLLGMLLGALRKLRRIADEHGAHFQSAAFSSLFSTVKRELTDDYLATIQAYLTDLRFNKGVLISVELGQYNESVNYLLRLNRLKDPHWLLRMIGKGSPGYTFHLAGPDEAGARILSEMHNRAISRVSVTLANSAEHVWAFFKLLRAELAFYVACLNLHGRLQAKGEPICFPTPAPDTARMHTFAGLYDVCLSLHIEGRTVGNSTAADGKNLVIITGANQGGKSSFLRSIGIAQVMMQCGMFVGAESFQAEVCPALFTHYKREEDSTMKSGKFDEEVSRMSGIVDRIVPNSIVLFNESFTATNEREGSEIASQIVTALLERRVKVFFVTHLYQFARSFLERTDDVLFLRPERKPDGTRTFRILEGEPLETSYGEDLYHEIFDGNGRAAIEDSARASGTQPPTESESG